jgi:hypothetical protein
VKFDEIINLDKRKKEKIMDFNQNDSKELLSNTLALNVALQTIKERCVHLQKRLYALESENSKLRLDNINNDKTTFVARKDNSLISELEDLRAKNAELTLQKNQLTENLSMISTENKKLWGRLSQLTKDNSNASQSNVDSDLAKGECNEPTKLQANLIRSKTFTQNSPHQLLREKIAGNHIGPQNELEDISLLNDCGFATNSAAAVVIGNNDTETSENCDIDTKSCTEGLLNIKRELLKQNSDLKVALSNWRKFKSARGYFNQFQKKCINYFYLFSDSEVCSCKTSSPAAAAFATKNGESSRKPIMVDKNLGTERVDLTLEFIVADQSDSPNNNFEHAKNDMVLADLIEKKRAADSADKVKESRFFNFKYTFNLVFFRFVPYVVNFTPKISCSKSFKSTSSRTLLTATLNS